MQWMETIMRSENKKIILTGFPAVILFTLLLIASIPIISALFVFSIVFVAVMAYEFISEFFKKLWQQARMRFTQRDLRAASL